MYVYTTKTFVEFMSHEGLSVRIDKNVTKVENPLIATAKGNEMDEYFPKLLSYNGTLTKRGRRHRSAMNTSRVLYAMISKRYYKNIAAYIAHVLLETLDDKRWGSHE